MTSDIDYIPSAISAVFSGDAAGKPSGDSNALLRDFVSDVAVGCAERGAEMIGHIKANFKAGEQFLSVSCTSLEGKTTVKAEFSAPVDEFTGVMNALVYGITPEEIKDALLEAADKAKILSMGEIRVEGGCEDPECDDPDCRKPSHRPLIPL